jgi:hypothetical protein
MQLKAPVTDVHVTSTRCVPAAGGSPQLSERAADEACAPARFCTPRGAVLAMVLALLALAGAASSAQAAITHFYTGTSFGPGGVGSGSFSRVVGVAVAQTSGDVFVWDAGEGGRVYKFSAAGAPVDFSSSGTNVIEGAGSPGGSEAEIAVDDSNGPDAGDIYVANNSVVRIYAASGAFLGELSGGEMCGVAVGSTGEVYVGIYPETVRRYKPVTNPVTNANETASMGGLSGICNVAVDSAGDVYAATYYGGVNKYDTLQFGSLTASGTLVDSRGQTLAVDPTSGEVFIDDADQIDQYDGSAEPPIFEGTTGSSGEGALSDSFGVAVNHSSGDVYAADASTVEIFGPGIVVAGASTEAATGVSSTDATLHGTVDPAGTEVTQCVFEYRTEAGGPNQTIPCKPATPYTGTTPGAVTAQLSGLASGTTYRYRITATNANGSAASDEATFRTLGPSISHEEAGETTAGVAHVHAEIDPEGEATTYRVEYGTSTAYGSSTSPVELEAGEAPQYIYVSLHKLQARTTYHARFVAVNGAATTTGPDFTFTTHQVVTDESFSQVGSSSAELSARVDAGGEAASYHAEYGTSTAYGSSTASVSVGASEEPVSVVAKLSELLPDTTYHFRIVAVKATETESGPDVVFTTHPLSIPGLPDDRGYEMVTPSENQGSEPYVPAGDAIEGEESFSTRYVSIAAEDGEAVAYTGVPTSTGNGNQGNGGGNQFLATRNPGGGWTQADIQPAGYGSPTYWGFSKNLEAGLLTSDEPLTADAPAHYVDLYVRHQDGSYESQSTVTPPDRTPREFGATTTGGYTTELSMGEHYAGASEDFTHVLFEANDALASGAVDPGPEDNNLYDSVNGTPQAVNVLPDGAAAPDASFGSDQFEGYEAKNNFSRVISSDGARVFWTDTTNGSLYVREDGTRTSLIAEGATYLTASTDGSKVLYTKAGDLFEDDLETGETHDLAPNGQVQGLVGASESLEYIYFVAEADLASGATAGQPNLYLAHNGATQFIATLGKANEESAEFLGYEVYPWQPDVGWRDAQVTPSGQTLVFMSKKSLTGYDNVSTSENGGFGPIVEPEVYVFDATSGQISCASCDSTGEQPAGSIGLDRVGGTLAISRHASYQQRVISDDGDRVFFESTQPLLPQADTGEVNVYEWERDGSGTCEYATGCIYLLSSPSGTSGSYFVSTSANGNDVFIMTRSQLVPSDKNEYNDIYDARVGVTQAPVPTQCTGTGCQGTPASPPVFATPASITFNGVGNLAPAPKPVSKPKPKPSRKKTSTCTVKKKKKGRQSSRQAKTKPVRCKAKKAAKHTRHEGKGGGR